MTRYRLMRLRWLDRATSTPVRRCEHDAQGDLIHIDVEKLGKIPDGGGWRVRGKAAGKRNSRAHTTIRSAGGHTVLGYLIYKAPATSLTQ